MGHIQKKYIKAWTNLIVAALIFLGCIFIAPRIIWLLMPFILGWLISLLANPAVRFLEEKLKIRRKASSVLVIVAVIAAICFAIYAICAKAVNVIYQVFLSLPELWSSLERELSGIGEKWALVIDRLPIQLVDQTEKLGEDIGEKLTSLIGELSVPTAGAVSSFAQNIPTIFMAVIMCLLSAYFFVAEKGYMTNLVRKYLPVSWRKKCSLMKQIVMDAMGGYVKAQLKIELWIYVIVAVGLLILRVPYFYLAALGIAFLDILPVFGTGTVLLPWAVLKFLGGQYYFAIGLLIIWGVGQLTRQVIQPKIVGDSLGIQPIPTLVLLYLGYQLAGVAGMIAAVPLGMLVMTMNDAGFFDNVKMSIRILWHGFNEFRRLTPEDMGDNAEEKEETDA